MQHLYCVDFATAATSPTNADQRKKLLLLQNENSDTEAEPLNDGKIVTLTNYGKFVFIVIIVHNRVAGGGRMQRKENITFLALLRKSSLEWTKKDLKHRLEYLFKRGGG